MGAPAPHRGLEKVMVIVSGAGDAATMLSLLTEQTLGWGKPGAEVETTFQDLLPCPWLQRCLFPNTRHLCTCKSLRPGGHPPHRSTSWVQHPRPMEHFPNPRPRPAGSRACIYIWMDACKAWVCLCTHVCVRVWVCVRMRECMCVCTH